MSARANGRLWTAIIVAAWAAVLLASAVGAR